QFDGIRAVSGVYAALYPFCGVGAAILYRPGHMSYAGVLTLLSLYPANKLDTMFCIRPQCVMAVNVVFGCSCRFRGVFFLSKSALRPKCIVNLLRQRNFILVRHSKTSIFNFR